MHTYKDCFFSAGMPHLRCSAFLISSPCLSKVFLTLTFCILVKAADMLDADGALCHMKRFRRGTELTGLIFSHTKDKKHIQLQ